MAAFIKFTITYKREISKRKKSMHINLYIFLSIYLYFYHSLRLSVYLRLRTFIDINRLIDWATHWNDFHSLIFFFLGGGFFFDIKMVANLTLAIHIYMYVRMYICLLFAYVCIFYSHGNLRNNHQLAKPKIWKKKKKKKRRAKKKKKWKQKECGLFRP